jgi:hypothetical protein
MDLIAYKNNQNYQKSINSTSPVMMFNKIRSSALNTPHFENYPNYKS